MTVVSMDEIHEVGARLGREFRPERVILFGSYAEGTAGTDSDVDLLVVLPFEGRPFHKSLEILNRLDVRFPCDLIARRPDDVARRYAQGDPLIREALDRGEVLYERDG
jgi:predicted nucleotidyltransferase